MNSDDDLHCPCKNTYAWPKSPQWIKVVKYKHEIMGPADGAAAPNVFKFARFASGRGTSVSTSHGLIASGL